MIPSAITPDRLKAYPEMARELVLKHAELLGKLPLPFASLLLREAIQYDWKFPLERREIESDFHFLESASPDLFERLIKPFRDIQLSAEITNGNWVADPVGFAEKLSAHLWATHQIDSFRSAAVVYMDNRTASLPLQTPTLPRLTLVLIGEGATAINPVLFRKLQRHGTYYTNVTAKNHLKAFLDKVSVRASSAPEPFGHWYIDGGKPGIAPLNVASVSYEGLSSARALLQAELKKSYEGQVGSENMRSRLAKMEPASLGLNGKGDAAVLERFALSLLTEGSGTQIYSTTFVQWAVREASRRAQPLTMFARFRPRQRERPMQELLLETQRKSDLDPDGSLVDADMSAYYAWVSQGRLPGSENASFLAAYEGHNIAVKVGPGVPKGRSTDRAIGLEELIGDLP